MRDWIREEKGKVGVWILALWVQPKAQKSEKAGIHDLPEGPALKLRVAAPPIDGAANDEVLRFLKRSLSEISNGESISIELLRGTTGRRKEVRVTALGLDLLRIQRWASE